jgi:CBS domain-containing protein
MNLRRLTGSARQEFESAYSQRQVVLKKSGMPVCEKADALMKAARTLERHELAFARRTLDEHAAECPICRERKEYADRHGPPLPPLPDPGWRPVTDVVNHLARLLRVPEGESGEERKMGLYAAVYYSLFAVVAVTINVTKAALHGALAMGDLGESFAVILGASVLYILILFLAGSVFDATRRVQGRLIGYVIRGALATAVAYGATAPIVGLLTKRAHASELWVGPLMLGFLGALAGIVVWTKDKARGRV